MIFMKATLLAVAIVLTLVLDAADAPGMELEDRYVRGFGGATIDAGTNLSTTETATEVVTERRVPRHKLYRLHSAESEGGGEAVQRLVNETFTTSRDQAGAVGLYSGGAVGGRVWRGLRVETETSMGLGEIGGRRLLTLYGPVNALYDLPIGGERLTPYLGAGLGPMTIVHGNDPAVTGAGQLIGGLEISLREIAPGLDATIEGRYIRSLPVDTGDVDLPEGVIQAAVLVGLKYTW